MTAYDADPEVKARKLRAVRAAVASALGNNCDMIDVMQCVQAGIDEDAALKARRPGEPLVLVKNSAPAQFEGQGDILDLWKSELSQAA